MVARQTEDPAIPQTKSFQFVWQTVGELGREPVRTSLTAMGMVSFSEDLNIQYIYNTGGIIQAGELTQKNVKFDIQYTEAFLYIE
jgi:hypothetical protein